MTRPTMMDHDHLAAFVDGELSPEEAAAVVMHLADHPLDQAYVDDLTAANAALAQAFAAPMEEPVPEAMQRLITGEAPMAQVLPFRRARPVIATAARWGGLAGGGALAAGLAFLLLMPPADRHDLAPGPLAADSPIARMLASLPTGTVQSLDGGVEAMILSSVPTPQGFCREIEVIHAEQDRLKLALACTEGAGWSVDVVIAESLADAGGENGFAPADGSEAQGIASFLDRIGAGAVLGPEEEALLIARGWRN